MSEELQLAALIVCASAQDTPLSMKLNDSGNNNRNFLDMAGEHRLPSCSMVKLPLA